MSHHIFISLSLFTSWSSMRKAIIDMRYMWSATDSGRAMAWLTHPVRLSVFSCPTTRKKARALEGSAVMAKQRDGRSSQRRELNVTGN